MNESYRGRRVLVTGADGFIGSHLAEALTQAGARVTALAHYNSFDSLGWLDDVEPALSDRMTFLRGDIRDDGFVDRIVEDQDIVFHLAALIGIPYSYEAPRSYVDTNVVGTLNVLEAARRHRTKRVIQTSTSEVYGTALRTPIDEAHPYQGQSPYSASKIGADMMAEAYARSFDLPVAILRPFNTFGPRQSERAVIPTILRQCLDPACVDIQVGDLAPKRDFVFVGDTVAAFMRIGAGPNIAYGSPYNAGTGQAVSIGEVIDVVQSAASSRKPVKIDPARMRPANSEVRVLLADSAKLAKATGWVAETSFGEGIRQTVEWWRRRISGAAVRRSRKMAL